LFSMFLITFFQSSGFVVASPKTLLFLFSAPVSETVLFSTIYVRIFMSFVCNSYIFYPYALMSSSLFFLSIGRDILSINLISNRLSSKLITSISRFSSSSSYGALKWFLFFVCFRLSLPIIEWFLMTKMDSW